MDDDTRTNLPPPQPRIPPPPPRFPAADDGGLGAADVGTGVSEPLVCIVGPWTQWQPGDTIRIEWGTSHEIIGTLAIVEAQPAYTQIVSIPAEKLMSIPAGLQPVRVAVAPGGTAEGPSYSDEVLVLIKRVPPGGIDPDPSTPGVNENLLAPTVVPDPLGDDLSSVVVVVPGWGNAEVGDILTVSWGGQPVEMPPLTTIAPPYRVPIPEDVIRKAGEGTFVITYDLRDRIGNVSLPSLPRTIAVALDRPPMPWVVGTVDNAGAELDIEALAGADVGITANWDKLLPTDEVRAHWLGKAADDTPVNVESAVATPAYPGAAVPLTIAHAVALAVAGGSVDVSYVVRRDALDKESSARHLVVSGSGTEPGTLAPPIASDAIAGELPALAAAAGIRIALPADTTIGPADDVVVRVDGAPASAAQPGDPAGMSALLAAAWASANLGQTVAIDYTVTPRAGGATRTSAPLVLAIGDIADNAPGFPPPLVVEAVEGVLDMSGFDDDATVRVPAWPLMAPGQRYWLTAIADDARHPIAVEETVDTTGDVTKPLARTWLDTLADASTFVVELKIAFDDNADEASARRFDSVVYTIVASASASGWGGRSYEFESFAHYDAKDFATKNGETRRFSLGTLRPIGGTISLMSLVSDSASLAGDPGLNNTLTTTCTLDHPCTGLSLFCWDDDTSTATTRDASGADIETRQLEDGTNELTAPSGRHIASIDFTTRYRTRIHWLLLNTGNLASPPPTMPFVDTFEDMTPGSYERYHQSGHWGVVAEGCQIAVAGSGAGQALAIAPLSDSDADPAVRLRPVHAVCPRVRTSIRVRSDGSRSGTVFLVYLSFKDGRPVERSVSKQIAFTAQAKDVEFTSAGQTATPDEYVSRIVVRMPLSYRKPFYIERIEFE